MTSRGRETIDEGVRRCPNCGEHKKRLSRHWRACGYPDVDWLTRQYFNGILLGGGTIQGNGEAKHLVVKSAKERLARWLFGELDFLAHSLRVERFDGERNPLYIVRTHAHDYLRQLSDEWYDEEGDKHIRSDVDLSADAARVWYALAGYVEQTGPQKSQWRIAFSAEADGRAERIQTLLSRHGVDSTCLDRRVVIYPSHARPWLEGIGGAIPGVEYKWRPERSAKGSGGASSGGGGSERSPPSGPTYSRDDVLDALRSAADGLGEPLSSIDYRDWQREQDRRPSVGTVCNNDTARFESWWAACEEAGVEPERSTTKGEWSQTEIIEALRHARDAIGGVPSTAEYREWSTGRPDAPSIDTVYSAFGDWESACKAIDSDRSENN